MTVMIILEALLIGYIIWDKITTNKNNIDQQEIDIIVNNAEDEIRSIIADIEDKQTKEALYRIIDMLFKGL